MLLNIKKGYAKKGSNVLLSTAEFIPPREILHFKRSNQNISRIELRCFTVFTLNTYWAQWALMRWSQKCTFCKKLQKYYIKWWNRQI